jgi:pimeloyl-ACP methyl ester carboxylesterase
VIRAYFVHAGWLDEGQLLRDVGRLRHIRAVIIQRRYDLATPAATAWTCTVPGPRLVLVEGAGHAFSEPGIRDALIAATDRFAAPDPRERSATRASLDCARNSGYAALQQRRNSAT